MRCNMQTKYNLGDVVWNYVFYEGINLKIRKCTIVGIRVTQTGGLEYAMESDAFYGTAHFGEDEIFADRRQVLQAAKESTQRHIAQLNAYIEAIDKELGDAD